MKPFASTFTSRREGSALVTTIIITGCLAAIAAALVGHALTERRINMRHALRLEAKNASEAIVEYGFAQLRNKFEKHTNFTQSALNPSSSDALILPDRAMLGANIDWDNTSIVGGTISPYPTDLTFIDPLDDNNENDPLKGQKVRQRDVAMFAKTTVKDPSGGAPIVSRVTQKLQVRDAYLFSHAIFYNLDLEFFPGAAMEIRGPVHTNGNLYVQGKAGLHFYQPVTSAKNLYYGWSTTKRSAQGTGGEALQTGVIDYVNRNNSLVSMHNGSKYVDSTHGTWGDYATQTWHGNVQTKDHSIQNYKPVAFSEYKPDDPNTVAYDPVNSGHDLIEPAIPIASAEYVAEIEKQKMAVKAGLRFVWDEATSVVKAYDKSGNELDISALQGDSSSKLWEVKRDVMYDHRRQKNITLVDINVGKLKQLIEEPGHAADEKIGGYNPEVDWNGVVYFETVSSTDPDHLSASGIRLWGGETDKSDQGIPSRGVDPGMTFATNNALYIKGHFNADGKIHTGSNTNSARFPEEDEVPVALFGDSVTLLSTGWDDNEKDKKPKAVDEKGKTQTLEVSAAIVTGLIPTDAGGNGVSSGGVHNLPRFLEAWSHPVYIRGSLVCLYESEVDDSLWIYNNGFYGPPGRNWGFNELFKTLQPPGTPLVRTYRRADFRELTEAEYQDAMNSLPW